MPAMINKQENQLDVQALINRLQNQLGAQLVRINLLEMEIERLQKQPATIERGVE